ncbi:MAG TPA: glycosyltransferase family 4 protein [Pyrinomonadaceae bacterium]|jgi:glycosyltransferase involved in cell wall biosynthesis|nr:glycosyltransferase family 4 protein [Pyrinomonadaceae bacterium]
MQLTDSRAIRGNTIKRNAVEVGHAGVMPSARVLYLTDLKPTGKFGSMEEQIFSLTRAFRDRNGLFLPVFGDDLSEAMVEKYQAEGLPVAGLNLHSFSTEKLSKLLSLIRDNRITAVHWNFYSPINPFVWWLSILKPSLTHYLTDHTSRELPLSAPPSGIGKLVKKLLFHRYKRVWCISDFVVHCLEHTGTWSNLKRCTYFINTDRFKPDPVVRAKMREQLGALNKFVVLFVANVIKAKGGDVAIRAMSQVSGPVQLWFVGDGPELEAVKTLAKDLNLGDRVQFLGRQSHVEPFMQAADCFICPSMWGEATGLVNLEAQSSGVPVIASEIGGIPEFVQHEKTGFLFAPGDDVALAKYIRTLAGNPELHSRFCAEARKTATERYSTQSRLDEYVRAYD